MRYDLLPAKGQFYKTNLHVHTTISDGTMTPEEVKEHYLKNGYSVVAFTDHEVPVAHPELTDENFIAITSFEWSAWEEETSHGNPSQRTYHLNMYAKDPKNVFASFFSEDSIWLPHSYRYIPEALRGQCAPHEHTLERINSVIQKANEEGYLVCYCHPDWSLHDYRHYAGLRGLWGVEVFNTGSAFGGYPENARPWDDILRQAACVGYLMLKAEKLEYGAVMKALERGDFYASTAPEISSITLEDGILKVDCSPAREIYIVTD